ncbi:hypothetical protein [Salinimonas lutimaris]|uniref:hypothetical protein n=1 Tax=Salinimonas lutimaris TaxID=914153 RepID=UPI0010C0E928|nr:hypothetical protein [Salinimonas lutimaris]
MKVGLKLNEHFTVSKHNIVQVTTFENEFQLALTNSEFLVISKDDKDNSYYHTHELNGCLIVPVNEYHRIQRELTEYFGVEIQDVSSDETKEQEEPEPTA